MENQDLSVFMSFIGVGATLLSVLSAVLLVRFSDHILIMFRKREELSVKLDTIAVHFSNFIDNIMYVSESAEKAIVNANESLRKGETEREVLHRFHFGGSGSGRTTVDNIKDIKECEVLLREVNMLKPVYIPLNGNFSKKDIYNFIKKLELVLREVEPNYFPDHKSSVIVCSTYEIVKNHINTLKNVDESIHKYRIELFSKPLIILNIFIVVYSMVAFILPISYLISCYVFSKPIVYVAGVSVLGAIVLCAYLLYLLYEMYILSILKWDNK